MIKYTIYNSDKEKQQGHGSNKYDLNCILISTFCVAIYLNRNCIAFRKVLLKTKFFKLLKPKEKEKLEA